MEALRRSAPASWPEDYIAFLKRNDGGRVAANLSFTVKPKISDTLASMCSASQVLENRSALVGRIQSNAWPIASTVTGNYVVIAFSDGWRIGFWDHETEEVTDFAGSFTEFEQLVRPSEDVELDPSKVISVKTSANFSKKFAAFMKK